MPRRASRAQRGAHRHAHMVKKSPCTPPPRAYIQRQPGRQSLTTFGNVSAESWPSSATDAGQSLQHCSGETCSSVPRKFRKASLQAGAACVSSAPRRPTQEYSLDYRFGGATPLQENRAGFLRPSPVTCAPLQAKVGQTPGTPAARLWTVRPPKMVIRARWAHLPRRIEGACRVSGILGGPKCGPGKEDTSGEQEDRAC